MAEIVGAVIHVLGPTVVDAIQRQFPNKVATKWNQRILKITDTVEEATNGEVDLDPQVLHGFLSSAAGYRALEKQMIDLNEAHKAGARNYNARRKAAKELAIIGRATERVGVSTSTVIRQKVLCKRAGHQLKCNTCPGFKLSCNETGHCLTCDICKFPESNLPQTTFAPPQIAAPLPPIAIVLSATATVGPLYRITTEEALHPQVVWAGISSDSVVGI